MAQALFGAPIALVTLVDRDEIWIKAGRGVDTCNLSRKDELFGTAIAYPQGVVVEDMLEDDRFRNRTRATGHPSIRFYAGKPIVFRGMQLGLLCVAGYEPRSASPSQLHFLEMLADMASVELEHHELRLRNQRASEESALTEQVAQTGSWEWDPATDHVRWSDGIYAALGLSLKEVRPSFQEFVSLVHPDDREDVVAKLRAAATDGRAFRSEYRIQRRDGAIRWIADHGQGVRDGNNGRIRLVGAIIDITDRKCAEAAGRASEARYRALVEASASIVWRATPDGSVFEAWGWGKYLGEPLQEYRGFGWVEALHPDDRGRVLAAWREAISDASPCVVEYRIRDVDGNFRWARARGVPFKNGGGSVEEWVGTLKDIHDQRIADLLRQRSEERLELAVEATELGIWDVDLTTDEREWAGQFRKIFGLADGEAPRRETFLARVHPADRAWIERLLYRDLPRSPGVRRDCEFRIHRADTGEERWVAAAGRMIVDGNGRPSRTLGTLHDVTERKRAEESLRASEERFRNISSTSPDAVICADQDGCVEFWNAAAEAIFGYSAADAIGQSVSMILPDRSREAHGACVAAAFELPPSDGGRTVELVGRHRDGHEIPIEVSLSRWRVRDGFCFGAIVRDVSERKEQEEQLYNLAHFDHLTALANRRLLQVRLSQALEAGDYAALLLLDLDGFKGVNDTLGHAAGDTLLVQFAERLSKCAPTGSLVARTGGDEFAVLLPGIADLVAASKVSACITQALRQPFWIQGQSARLASCFGIAIAPEHGATSNELMASADLALYSAKHAGRGVTRAFSPQLRQAAQTRRTLEQELQEAFERRDLEMHFQPQVRISDRAVVGAEALLRWRRAGYGLVMPAGFIDVLGDSPLAEEVGRWSIREACREAAALRGAGHPTRIAVNLFSAQFRDRSLVEVAQQALNEAEFPANLLELEITEDIILEHDETVLEVLEELRAIGVGIAFDDFGTGFASLSMLKRFPVTKLKIDKGFVLNLSESDKDLAIVDAVVKLASSFGLDVIAEGVENERNEDVLRDLGCQEAQGFLYGKAMDATALEALITGAGRSAVPARAAQERREVREQDAVEAAVVTGKSRGHL